MSPRPRRARLVWRVYGFAALLSIGIITALMVLPKFTRSAKYYEPQAALAQYLVERLSLRRDKPISPNGDDFTTVATRIEGRLKGTITLYDVHGTMLRTNAQPPNPFVDAQEAADLKDSKWSLSQGRIVVRSDDGSLIGVYYPNRPPFPWTWVLPFSAVTLLLVGAASVWFVRRLARPLDQLATAARRFGEGDLSARAALGRDDELGDVGRAFDEMARRTSVVLQTQRQLMGDVSHELRTPLARIRVALELVVEDPVAAKDVLADVGMDLDEIDQLISDILTTARLDGEKVEVTLIPTNLGEIADRAVKRFATKHPDRKLEHAVAGADREIACDAVLLRRAVDNLLDNAAKYSDAKSPVSLAVVPNGTSVAFEIVDRGIGMSAKDLERAGTPFWRADGSRTRKTGGVGLGLALARRIARVHGGDVTLTSQLGKGTTARLDVPLAVDL